jgi:hypothetical protein
MSAMDELAKRLAAFEGRQAKVGWFETARYPDGKQVAEVAIIQEMGAPGASIPARPFIRPTVEAKREEWTEQFIKGAKAVVRGAVTAEQVLEIMGQKAAGDIRTVLASGDFLKLSPITLMLRKWKDEDSSFKVNGTMVGAAAQAVKEGEEGSSRTQPLHDTGLMIATLTSVVGDDE